MKRFYVTVALLGGFGLGAAAQTIDLAADVIMYEGTCLQNGEKFQADDTTVAPFGVWGIFNNGPESMGTGDNIMFIYPKGSVSAQGVSVWTAPINGDIPAGNYAFLNTGLEIDSINTLLDIQKYEGGATKFSEILVPRASFVNDKEYGFYLYVVGMGTDPNVPSINTDDSLQNNMAYVKVKWNCNATSVSELIKNVKAKPITVYPNPAAGDINFDYTFDKTSNATVKILDISGRTLFVKDLGKMSAGSHTIKVDISSLNTGIYMIEFNDGTNRATNKFTVDK